MRVSIGSFKTGSSSIGEFYLHRVDGCHHSDQLAPPSLATRPVATAGVRDACYNAILESLTLSSVHVVQLLERGLDEETITRNLYATAGSCERMSQLANEVAKLMDVQSVPGFSRSQGHWRIVAEEGELLIPVRDPGYRIIGLRRRTDNADKRYLWVSSQESPSGSPPHHAEPWNVEFRPVLLMSEGELKSDTIAHRLRFTTIGLPGAGSIPPGFGSMLQEAYPSVRSIFIAFDADVSTNPRVRDGRDRLMRTLKTSGYSVHLLEWHERDGKGLDDVLARTAA